MIEIFIVLILLFPNRWLLYTAGKDENIEKSHRSLAKFLLWFISVVFIFTFHATLLLLLFDYDRFTTLIALSEAGK